MTPNDIARVQTYLRGLFGSQKINLLPPAKKGLSVELEVGGEVVGTVHRDEDEGEVSYAVSLIVLDEDLPAPAKEAAKPARR